jgi:hypothetical protein
MNKKYNNYLMDSKTKYHLSKNQNPLFKELTINRLKKNNKILISKYQNNDNNSVKVKTSADQLQKIQKDNNLTNYKNSILNHIRISENPQNVMGKSLHKNTIYELSDLVNNINTAKSHSINIKQKNSITTNINNMNKRNIGSYSIGKINRKTIEKEKNLNNNDFQLSSKTFNFNNINKNEFASNDKTNLRGNKVFKKNSHDIARNIDNIDIDNLINKFKQYKIINKNTDKNNININLNINNIQNIQNIQNIETIDINKINPNQRLLLIKNGIFNSYINCGKEYKDKIAQDQHFKTLQNYSLEKKKNNHVFSTNSNTFRNTNNSSGIKNKLNSIRDNLFNKNNAKKNIKLNYNILINKTSINTKPSNNNQELLPKFSSFETINNNKRNYSLKTKYNSNDTNNNYIYDFSNEIYDNKTINNETIQNNGNKKLYFRVLSSKKKKFISFGEILKKENQLINHKPNNSNNIILKLSKIKKNNPGILPKNINVINNYNSNNSKPKNYFNHKNAKANIQKEINNNYYTINTKNNNNAFNLIKSPQEQGLKLLLKNKKINIEDKNTFIKDNKCLNNKVIEYINTNPEKVKEYTEEILINLLIEEYLFNKKKKLILNTDILNNYGINPIIRACLIDSLIGLQDTFKCCDKTIFITIKIFDNYISSIINDKDPNFKIEDSDLDIIIVSCFLIASKMEESFIYHLTDYLSILSDKYNTTNLTNIEYNILKYYNFENFEPNSLDFYEIFSSLYELDDKTKKKGISFLIGILLNVDLSQIPSSVIAFSILYLVYKKDFNMMMKKIDNLFYNLHKWSDWNAKNYKDKEKNEIYSKYMKLIEPLKKEKNIKEISDMILLFMENIPKSEFINTIKKIDKYK